MPRSVLLDDAPVAVSQDVSSTLARVTDADPTVRAPRRRRFWPWLRVVPLVLAIACVLIVAGVATGLNLAGSPHYESDEGTYVGSAWSMFQEGKLSYYTYNYDHPPLGWLIIGVWAQLVGGFTAFGNSITTARALMVVVTLGSTLMILLIVRRLSGSLAGGVCAGVLFAVSPLGTALHRQVWLDNIATFWLLLSLWCVLGASRSLARVLLSAFMFGLAFWTKEVMAIFLPAMLVVVAVAAHASHRRFAVALWAATTVSMVSLFMLLAFLKDELLSPGLFWSSVFPHVSLLDTYAWQMSRAGGGSVFSATGNFRQLFDQWWQADPVLIVGGIVGAVLALVLVRSLPVVSAIALLALSFLLFLARGGVVLYYYIIPVLALLSIVLGVVQGYGAQVLGKLWRPLGRVAAAAILVFAFLRVDGVVKANLPDFSQKPTVAQDAAATWMIRNLPHDSTILMDSYAWVEMRDPATTGGSPFANAHYYWPGVSDPSVRDGVLHADWRNVDYLAVSPSVEADMASRDLPILPDALANADEIRTFFSDGWSVRILRVRKLRQQAAASDTFLTDAWATYKAHYLHDGQVVDPLTGLTTSEAQSYALLRAVYVDDRPAFDQIWSWTKAHLQVRPTDALLAWAYGPTGDGTSAVLDLNSATDADQDTALALLFASRRWAEPVYQTEALRGLNDIWSLETAMVADQRVVTGGSWAGGNLSTKVPDPVINPSYFAPYAYRIFAEADAGHTWLGLVDSSYDLLGRIHASPDFGGAGGVVPNWLALDATTGELKPADALGADWALFGYDASRLPWRLALDWLWFRDNRARQALNGIDLPYRELARTHSLAATYAPDGTPVADYESTSMYATTLAGVLVAQDQSLAQSVFADKVLRSYSNDGTTAAWGDVNNYYDQNWGWFATALIDGGMTNLWAGETILKWDQGLLP